MIEIRKLIEIVLNLEFWICLGSGALDLGFSEMLQSKVEFCFLLDYIIAGL